MKRILCATKRKESKNVQKGVTKQSITAIRRGLKVEYELPLVEQYANMVTSFLD